MGKGEQTREMILEKAAQLFSRQGYFGSSISDLVKVTGLEKGGIYNHFVNKENLALEAFDYSFELVWFRAKEALEGKTNSIERLLTIVSVFQSLVEDSPLEGGCPVLNTAVEADDAMPSLRDRARRAMDVWRDMVRRTINKGKERQEIRAEVEADAAASIIISSLEGAIMMSRLYNDPVHIYRTVSHLSQFIETTLKA